jgi:hypothetical protein
MCFLRYHRSFRRAQESYGIGATGRNHFYIDSTKLTTIRVNETQPATPADPLLQGVN